MGRKVEEAMLYQIIEKAKNLGIKKIKGKFIPTKKNKPAENFYSDCDFKKEGDYWIFNTDQVMKKPEQIKLRNNTN